mgnify:CR=1 FL=1
MNIPAIRTALDAVLTAAMARTCAHVATVKSRCPAAVFMVVR